jgi:hypothetical protein
MRLANQACMTRLSAHMTAHHTSLPPDAMCGIGIVSRFSLFRPFTSGAIPGITGAISAFPSGNGVKKNHEVPHFGRSGADMACV